MPYRIFLNDVDRDRLANLLKFAIHNINVSALSNDFTGEDIALAQRMWRILKDKRDYFIITDELRDD